MAWRSTWPSSLSRKRARPVLPRTAQSARGSGIQAENPGMKWCWQPADLNLRVVPYSKRRFHTGPWYLLCLSRPTLPALWYTPVNLVTLVDGRSTICYQRSPISSEWEIGFHQCSLAAFQVSDLSTISDVSAFKKTDGNQSSQAVSILQSSDSATYQSLAVNHVFADSQILSATAIHKERTKNPQGEVAEIGHTDTDF